MVNAGEGRGFLVGERGLIFLKRWLGEQRAIRGGGDWIYLPKEILKEFSLPLMRTKRRKKGGKRMNWKLMKKPTGFFKGISIKVLIGAHFLLEMPLDRVEERKVWSGRPATEGNATSVSRKGKFGAFLIRGKRNLY